MRIAIVSDDLIQHGGQERVLEAFIEMFPGATLYASIISPDWKHYLKTRNVKFVTSFLDKFPFTYKLSRYYSPFLLHNLAYESFDLSSYDLVISNSSRFAHLVITKPSTFHICYMHSPGRMYWMSKDYFKNETFGILRPFKNLGNKLLSYTLILQRMLDYAAAKRVDKFIVNSELTKSRVKKFYGLNSQVMNPFIEAAKYNLENKTPSDYFVVISRLVSWKRIDIAIKASMELGLQLKVIGCGPDENRLKNIAGNSSKIQFLGAVSEESKIKELANSTALIQTQYEDFGLVPLEANAAGKVVIGYGKGGITETMLNGKTAIFFNEQTVDSLKSVLIGFVSDKYDINECQKNAQKYDKSAFKIRFFDLLNQL